MDLWPISTHHFWNTQPIRAQKFGTASQPTHKKAVLLANQCTGIHVPPSQSAHGNTLFPQPIGAWKSGTTGQSPHRNLVLLAIQHAGIPYPQPISTLESGTLSKSTQGNLLPPANRRTEIWHHQPITKWESGTSPPPANQHAETSRPASQWAAEGPGEGTNGILGAGPHLSMLRDTRKGGWGSPSMWRGRAGGGCWGPSGAAARPPPSLTRGSCRAGGHREGQGAQTHPTQPPNSPKAAPKAAPPTPHPPPSRSQPMATASPKARPQPAPKRPQISPKTKAKTAPNLHHKSRPKWPQITPKIKIKTAPNLPQITPKTKAKSAPDHPVIKTPRVNPKQTPNQANPKPQSHRTPQIDH